MLGDASTIAQLPVKDLERAKKFYTEILGLKVVEAYLHSVVFLEAGAGTKLMLFHTPDHQISEHAYAQFLVKDIQAEITELKKHGVECEQFQQPVAKTGPDGIATVGPAHLAWFKDSEGNLLALLQRANS